MDAWSNDAAEHPQFVSIPDPQHVRGIRAYSEPVEPCPLQLTFLDPAGECAWKSEMRQLLADGRAKQAAARLNTELEGFDGAIARLCKATAAEGVFLEGWDDLPLILAEWEGPPITAITVGLTNARDLVFGGGQSSEPDLLVRLYSDDAFPFSGVSKAQLLAESLKEEPVWIGAEEDVEFYCTLAGVAELNAALINCKHRHFLRDGSEARAPGAYVEYVLGSWLLATRFLQAVTRTVSQNAVPAACRLIVGTADFHADFITIIGADRPTARVSKRPSAPAPTFATLTGKSYLHREKASLGDAERPGSFRKRLVSAEPPSSPDRRRGFFATMLESLREWMS